MALEQYFDEATIQTSSFREEKSSLGRLKSDSSTTTDSSGGFDCNICLDVVQDPVVTLCGHLFCWPCIYKWLQFQDISAENQANQPQQQCPVCKSQISHTTLVPLYGKGQPSNPTKSEAQTREILIPHRPPGPSCSVFHSSSVDETHNGFYQSRMGDYGASIVVPSSTISTANMLSPSVGVFGEMVYARAFGNTITNLYVYPNSYNLLGSSSPRIRRHIMKADKSLNRICIFFFCCLILCLLLF